jgi:hypothetical protein
MIKIYMVQTLNLIAQTNIDFVNDIVANSTQKQLLKNDTYYFIQN